MTSETFQQSGTVPVEIERLNKVDRTGEMAAVVDFRILAEMLSRPEALLVSIEKMIWSTSSSEHSRLLGQSDGSTIITSPAVGEVWY